LIEEEEEEEEGGYSLKRNVESIEEGVDGVLKLFESSNEGDVNEKLWIIEYEE
jgi:hypothetical protein